MKRTFRIHVFQRVLLVLQAATSMRQQLPGVPGFLIPCSGVDGGESANLRREMNYFPLVLNCARDYLEVCFFIILFLISQHIKSGYDNC
jgi:hypothetical protein